MQLDSLILEGLEIKSSSHLSILFSKIASIVIKLFIMKYGVLKVKFYLVYSGVSSVCFENIQWTILKYDNKGTLNLILNRIKFL